MSLGFIVLRDDALFQSKNFSALRRSAVGDGRDVMRAELVEELTPLVENQNSSIEELKTRIGRVDGVLRQLLLEMANAVVQQIVLAVQGGQHVAGPQARDAPGEADGEDSGQSL